MLFFFRKYHIWRDLGPVHCSKISKIFRSIPFSMFTLLQNSPRQSPLATTHFRPLRKHEHIRELHVFLIMFYNYTVWNLAYGQVLAQYRFSSAAKYLSYGTNPYQVGLIIWHPRCSIDKLVNELVKYESVLFFQMEADSVAWELKELLHSP